MAVSPEYKAFIAELLEPLGDVNIRGMFGGGGVFCHGVMFGLIVGERLYLKVDDGNRAAFEDEDCEPFTYQARNNKRSVMSYYEVPDRLYDEPDEMIDWAREALDAALRQNAKKPKKKGTR